MTRTALPVSAGDPVDDFDPNTSFGSVKFFLTYDGDLKLRRGRGPAITDFNHARKAKLFEWDPSVAAWRLIAHKTEHDPRCDHCGLTTFDWPHEWNYRTQTYDQDTTRDQENLGRWCFLRKGSSRKLVEPIKCLYLCQVCQEAHA